MWHVHSVPRWRSSAIQRDLVRSRAISCDMLKISSRSELALDDRDTKNAHFMREYGCLRGLQPSPADCCCPFGMDCNSVRPRLAHVIMDGWRTIPKSFRCDMARARLRLIDEEITSPVHNPGTRHSVGNARIVNRSRGSKRSELSACPQRVTCGNDAFVTRLYELLTALAYLTVRRDTSAALR